MLCNGALVSRTTYAALFAVIGTVYGEGDGSTTFALPNLVDRFIQGSASLGTVKSAGLPNILGEFITSSSLIDPTGAFAFSSQGTIGIRDASTGTVKMDNRVSFNAAYGGGWGIYGTSSTVQPPALTMRFYIKY